MSSAVAHRSGTINRKPIISTIVLMASSPSRHFCNLARNSSAIKVCPRAGPHSCTSGERVLGRDRDGAAAVGIEKRRWRLAAEGFDARDRGVVERRQTRFARQRGFDKGLELAPLFAFAHRVALLELGHDALGKDLERLADVLVAISAALLDEHDLVDAGLLIARQMRTRLAGGADAAAPGIVRQLVLDLQKALPEIGAARPVLAKQRVIAERVAKEAKPVEPATDRFALVRVTGHAGDDRNVRIDAMADRQAFVRFDGAVIFLNPLCRLVGVEK